MKNSILDESKFRIMDFAETGKTRWNTTFFLHSFKLNLSFTFFHVPCYQIFKIIHLFPIHSLSLVSFSLIRNFLVYFTNSCSFSLPRPAFLFLSLSSSSAVLLYLFHIVLLLPRSIFSPSICFFCSLSICSSTVLNVRVRRE